MVLLTVEEVTGSKSLHTRLVRRKVARTSLREQIGDFPAKVIKLHVPFELTILLERIYPKAIIKQVNAPLASRCSMQGCYSQDLDLRFCNFSKVHQIGCRHSKDVISF